MSAVEAAVSRIIEITGANKAEAEQLLSVCDDNIEAAITLYFEQNAGDSIVEHQLADAAEAAAVSDDEVRAPIAPVREQLLQAEHDNFNHRLAHVQQRIKVCPLRDFAREGALMEAELAASSSVNLQRTRRAVNMVFTAQEQSQAAASRLEDLFRPPTDLLYAGTFQAARARATALKHWLLINVQTDNFDSQILNRDVWSDKEMRKLVRKQFVLWQVDSDSTEGRRFIAFYHCARLPYVCIVDPRTGEEMWRSLEPKQKNIMPDLLQFLSQQTDFTDLPGTSGAKRAMPADEVIIVEDSQEAVTTCSNNMGAAKRSKIIELSEEEQIALAIKNSIRENGVAANKELRTADDDDDDASSVEEFFVEKPTVSSYEQHLGNATHEITTIKLRLLNDEIVQLRWPSDTLLSTLRQYISQQQPHIAKQTYKLICAFPRKTLDVEHDERTLKEMDLHPSANLHVSLED